jgi:hypothetical protein
MSNQPPKKVDIIKALKVNPDGTLVVEETEKRVVTVRTGPKWGPKPHKEGRT